MKKVYIAPELDIEMYELSDNIAANCGYVVSNGPEVGGYKACDEFKDSMQTRARGAVYNVSFYENVCDCYYTAGGEGFWQS